MKVLVTGGNGFVGRDICKYLVSKGVDVRSLDLQSTEGLAGVESLQGDILDEATVKRAVEGVQRVIHTAAVVPIRKSGKKYLQVNAEGTRLVLGAAISAGVTHFTYMSSSAVYGLDGQDGGASAPTIAPNPMDEYGRSKLEGERICRSHRAEIGLGILRPRTILGPGRLGIFSLLFDRVAAGKDIFTLGAGDRPLQLIALDDVTHLTAECSLKQSDGTFNLGGFDPRTMRETLEGLCAFAQTGSKVRTLPALPLKVILRTLDQLQLSPFASWHYETLNQAMSLNTSLTIAKLGSCKTGSVQALLNSYTSYASNPSQMKNSFDKYTHREAAKPGIFRWF